MSDAKTPFLEEDKSPAAEASGEEAPHLIADLTRVPPRFSVSAVAALFHIQRDRRQHPARLSEIIGVSAAAMTGTIDTLENRGLVTRRRDPADRRKIVVELTEEGQRVADVIFQLTKLN